MKLSTLQNPAQPRFLLLHTLTSAQQATVHLCIARASVSCSHSDGCRSCCQSVNTVSTLNMTAPAFATRREMAIGVCTSTFFRVGCDNNSASAKCRVQVPIYWHLGLALGLYLQGCPNTLSLLRSGRFNSIDIKQFDVACLSAFKKRSNLLYCTHTN